MPNPHYSVGSWQWRAIEHTRGNSTDFGAVMLAVLECTPHNPPAYGFPAFIDMDGHVMAWYLDRQERRLQVDLGPVHLLRDQFRRVADQLKFSDAERLELFAKIHMFLPTDKRATSGEPA